MHCPFCGHDDTKVIDSRLAGQGRQVRRRRQCLGCSERFTTFEEPQLLMPQLVKDDERREPFNERKLRAGIAKALEKRPVSQEDVDAAIGRLTHTLRATGEREVSSRLVGDLVMEELRKLDPIAYVRFASVYRSFQDVDAFREEVEKLKRRSRVPDERQMSLLPTDTDTSK